MTIGYRTAGFVAFAPLLMIGPIGCASVDTISDRPEFRTHGVIIHVTDMDEGIAFFTETMGFNVSESDGDMVRLDAETLLYLTEAAIDDQRYSYGEPRTTLVFQTADISSRQADMTQRGVVFIDSEPTRNGVGVASLWRDPFQTVHSLLEFQVAPLPPFEEPHIYNYGFVHHDLEAIRPFYIELLGFPVMTERYFPPALPLNNVDGSFGFMLHENDTVESAPVVPGDGPGVSILFATDDLEAAANYLSSEDVPIRWLDQDDRNGRRALIISDPAGIESEIWEVPAP